MKLNVDLYIELLQEEVLRLRSSSKRQGAIADLLGVQDSDVKAAEEFRAPKNLVAEHAFDADGREPA